MILSLLVAFTLVGRDRYIDETYSAPGRTGAEILRTLCFEPPPSCERGSAACSVAPEYPLVETRYDIRVKRTHRRRFAVTAVTVAAASRYAPMRAGRIHRWRPLRRGSRAAHLVQAHLHGRDGATLAGRRLRALELFALEVSWHERQHARHFADYFSVYERIVNDPRYPRVVHARTEAGATRLVESAVARDRNARLEKAAARLDACARGFHRREAHPDGFASRVGACACHGGTACEGALPPFPPEYRCDFAELP